MDLNPAGASSSIAYATTGGQQAGYANFGGNAHAGIWSGTAGSFMDLGTSLGAAFGDSYAQSIWTDGSTTLVAGMAYPIGVGFTRAILWTIVPEPSSLSLAVVSLAGLGILRRHRR